MMESLCEFGFVTSETEWDEEGKLKRTRNIDSADPSYKIILLRRDLHKRPRK